MTESMVMVLTLGKMEDNMLVNGRMESNMEKDFTNKAPANRGVDSGRMEKESNGSMNESFIVFVLYLN